MHSLPTGFIDFLRAQAIRRRQIANQNPLNRCAKLFADAYEQYVAEFDAEDHATEVLQDPQLTPEDRDRARQFTESLKATGA